MWKLFLILGAVLLAAYRARFLRSRGVPVAVSLGFGLDRRPFLNLAIGIFVSAAAMTGIFLLEWSSGLLSVTRINPPSALTYDLLSFIAVALTEEFLFRCAILGVLLLLIRSSFVAVAISAVLFGG